MSDEEEFGFEDWEKQAEHLVIDNKEGEMREEQSHIQMVKDNPELHRDPYDEHLKEIERIKNMTSQQFAKQFLQKDDKVQKVQPFSALLKSEKEFVDLANSIGSHFRTQAKNSSQKVLPQNETVAFFEQFLLYLYPDIQWESIQAIKQKTKIVKKQKKEEQAKVKKMREKEMRLKRGFNKQQNNQKQPENTKVQHNEMNNDEGM